MRRFWSFMAILTVLGLVFIALPQLPYLSFTKMDGVFSILWLFMAGCAILGHAGELRKRPKKRTAQYKLREPKVPNRTRVRGSS